MDNTNARDALLAMVYTAMPLTSDAIVVLCGEDATARLATGVEWLRQGAAPRIVLSGGLHTPPRVLSAESLAPDLLAMGVSPDRVIVETASTNTREQAIHVMAMAQENQWLRRELNRAVPPAEIVGGSPAMARALRSTASRALPPVSAGPSGAPTSVASAGATMPPAPPLARSRWSM